VGIDYVELAVSIFLQTLRSSSERSKRRRAILKVFKAISDAFKGDPEFIAASGAVRPVPPENE